jgi:hypothetical protein
VGTLDEAHGHDSAALACPVDHAAQVVLGVAQVGLHDDAGLVVGAELLLVEELGEDREGEVAVAIARSMLTKAPVCARAEDRPQAVLDRIMNHESSRVDLRKSDVILTIC